MQNDTYFTGFGNEFEGLTQGRDQRRHAPIMSSISMKVIYQMGRPWRSLARPKNLARRLVADYYMDEARDIPEENQKSPLGLAKIITLALLASPILIPVAITVVALIFAIVVTFAALAFFTSCHSRGIWICGCARCHWRYLHPNAISIRRPLLYLGRYRRDWWSNLALASRYSHG